jgi:hypothetical protein
MKKPKLELSELTAYFPYQVKAKFKSKTNGTEIGTVGQIFDNCSIDCYDTVNSYPEKFKLLLRPMSCLTDKFISDLNLDVMDAVAIEEIRDKQLGFWNAPYNVIQILLKNHVDVFNLLENGLAEELK